MDEKVIKTFKASNYMGTYAATVNGYIIEGSFSTNEAKAINAISGSVYSGKEYKAGFNGYPNGEGMRYNLNDVTDIAHIAEIASAVQTAVGEVMEGLAEEN